MINNERRSGKTLWRSVCPMLSLFWLLSAAVSAEALPRAWQPEAPAEWWYQRHEEKLAEIRRVNPDLVFIGDSITQYMDDRAPGIVQRTFPGMTSLNLGFSADKTENVLWRLQHGEIEGVSPKLVILQIGTNNTGHRKDPAEVTVGGIRRIVEEVRRRLPESKLLLLAIFPRGESPEDPLRQLNAKINQLLPELADGQAVHFLDITADFLDADGRLDRGVMPDFLHPGPAGYTIWMNAMKPTVERLIHGQTGVPPPSADCGK